MLAVHVVAAPSWRRQNGAVPSVLLTPPFPNLPYHSSIVSWKARLRYTAHRLGSHQKDKDQLDTIETFLAHHPYFQDVGKEEIARIARLATIRQAVAGEVLALEGDPCRAVYFVMRGRVRAFKLSPQGREQIINDLLPGQIFYLVPALDGGALPTTTRAATRATLLSFPCAAFVRMLDDHPTVAVQVLREFAGRLRALSSLVEDLSLRTVPQRLAKFLAERAQEGAPKPGQRQLTQREIASQLGTVREVIARSLADFDQRGWINLQRGVIEVVDLDALVDFANQCGPM
jgi:CRP/FNR family cyclic AMP-dependent transcriptional regulator